MSKYDPLSQRLAGHAAPEWRTTFSEIESVLGFPLPKAARSGRWWREGAGAHARTWSDAGWVAHEVDPAAGQVVFRKAEQSPLVAPAVAEGAPPQPSAVVVVGEEPAIVRGLERPKWAMAAVAGGLALLAGGVALGLRAVMRRGR